LPADAFVYLFLGQIRRYKGLEGLLDAFWQSSDDVSWLVIAGNVHDAEYADELQQMADGRPRLLTWLRYVPDGEVQMFMNACDICVLPYREVTTSGAAVLSFSFGRPIVAPSLGSFGEMAGDGRGILYDPDDGEGLAQALARARSGDLAVAGRRALAWAEEHTWSALAPAFLRMYSDALASR
jgi:glycosyltransferase involved in cell wall biosynthesis